ncbi:MAG: methyltransferase domain-containing protein [Nocardioides sp.]
MSGLPELDPLEKMRAELDILGLDASRHVVDTYAEFLDALGVTRSRDLLRRRSKAELLVAGVKVATQTPPIRSGRRVVFLTLDDATGPVDATFFEDAQGPLAATVFGSWLLVVRGELRRTGRRGSRCAPPAPGSCRRWPRCGERGRRGGARADGRGAGGFLGVGWLIPARPPEPPRAAPPDRSWRHRTSLRARVCRAAAHQGRCRRHGAATGAGALQRVRDVAVLRHQAGGESTKDAAREASKDVPRRLWHRNPGARDDRGRRRRRPPARTGPGPRVVPCPAATGLPTAPAAAGRRAHRVVWRALQALLDEPGAYAEERARVVDLGGGTGGFAVPLAELGHQVLVVDPSPDALAALARRADSGVTDRVTGVQGDLTDLVDVVAGAGQGGAADLVLCHGVLEVVDDPGPPWWRCARCSAPAAPSRCWSPSGTPPSSPGPWPATSPRPAPCWRAATPRGAPVTGSPASSSRRWSPRPGSPSPTCTPCGSSPIWCPAVARPRAGCGPGAG